MHIDKSEFVWCEKFRPDTVDECILPSHIKKVANGIVKAGNLQNMLFYSGAGTGKTTTAIALCKELDLDYILINGSKEGRLIETVRNTVSHFANTMSVLNGGSNKCKVVIYDEFDNAGEVQMAVRGLMDEVSKSCRFIFTGNYITKIIEPIQSRTTLIDFSVPKDQQPVIMASIMRKCCEILDYEGITYNKKVLAQFIGKFFPDFRRIINELQSYSVTGTIDAGILELTTSKYETLIEFIRNKDFKGCEKWLNGNSFDGSIYSLVVKNMKDKFKGNNYLQGILITNEYQCKHLQAIDPEINLLAFCIDMMETV